MSPNVDKGHTTHFMCYEHFNRKEGGKVICCQCARLDCSYQDVDYLLTPWQIDKEADFKNVEHIKRTKEAMFGKLTELEQRINNIVYANVFGDARPMLSCPAHELSKAIYLGVEPFLAESRRRTIWEIKELVKKDIEVKRRVPRVTEGQGIWLAALRDVLANLEAMK